MGCLSCSRLFSITARRNATVDFIVFILSEVGIKDTYIRVAFHLKSCSLENINYLVLSAANRLLALVILRPFEIVDYPLISFLLRTLPISESIVLI
jgi:hypothetical protein